MVSVNNVKLLLDNLRISILVSLILVELWKCSLKMEHVRHVLNTPGNKVMENNVAQMTVVQENN